MVLEHGITLGLEFDALEAGWQQLYPRHLHTSDVVKIAVAVGVAANAVGMLADLPRDLADVRFEALPQLRNLTDAGLREATTDTGDGEAIGLLEAHGLDCNLNRGRHILCLI
ncbi:hypothetical protein D3C80_1349390 [compost metagenome]